MSASFSFRPAASFNDRHGLFVAVAGGTNSGKSYSALRLARGIAGPKGKVAVVDTEGGRILHLKDHFAFDVVMMDPPHRPGRYADAAKAAEDAGFDVVVFDSFSMEWVGIGGVLDWQASDFERMGGQEKMKLVSWIKPKMAHKAMVYSFLQRRIPIVFSIRAEEKAKKIGSDVKSEWGPICSKTFPFEVTVSFMLMQNRQGVIDLSLPHKLEGAHRPIFRDGDQLSEEHGAALAAWASGGMAQATPEPTKKRTLRDWIEEAITEINDAPDVGALLRLIDAQMDGFKRVQQAAPDQAERIQQARRERHDRLSDAEVPGA